MSGAPGQNGDAGIDRSGAEPIREDISRMVMLSALVTVALALVSVLALPFHPDGRAMSVLLTYFDANSENNFFSWYSTVLLFLNALVLMAAGRAWRPRAAPVGRGLALLGVIFLVLSLDEMTSIHERLGALLSSILLGRDVGFLWVIPGAIFTAIVAAGILPLLRMLPRVFLARMLIAGGIYVAGALGMEGIGWAVFSAADGWSLTYALLAWIEEALEVAGQVLFFDVMLCVALAPGRGLAMGQARDRAPA